MGFTNGELFEKPDMENSIFSPNNAPGNRNQVKMAKNDQIRQDVNLVLTTPNKAGVSLAKTPIPKSGKSSAPSMATSKTSKILSSGLAEISQPSSLHSAIKLNREEDRLCDPRKTICGSPDDPTKPTQQQTITVTKPSQITSPNTLGGVNGLGTEDVLTLSCPAPGSEEAPTRLRPEDGSTLSCPGDVPTPSLGGVVVLPQRVDGVALLSPPLGPLAGPLHTMGVSPQGTPSAAPHILQEVITTSQDIYLRLPCPERGNTSPPISILALKEGLAN